MNKFYYAIIVLLSLNFFNVFGQIYSTKAEFIENTKYETLDRIDSIYVFNLSEDDDTSNIGLLEINSPDNNSNWEFSWYLFDNEVFEFNFQQLIKTDVDTNYSSLNNVDEGGYSVIFSNGIDTDTAYAWVFINEFLNKEFRITHKDDDGVLLPARYTCDYLELKAQVGLDTFYYYDELSKDAEFIATTYNYSWTSDPTGKNPNETRIGHKFTEIRSRTYEPPTEDTHYFLRVIDKYGIEKLDTVFYETIHTKAVLDTIPQWLKFDNGDDYYRDNEKASSPLTILFSPKESENAHKFVWNFGDGGDDTTYFQPDSVEHSFFAIDPQANLNPYTITLTTFSEEGCESTDSVEITLENSELGIPPFFSPNDDGNNDRWRVYDVSLREFEVTIFNRWGRIVHKFDGDDIRDWEGWDGNFKDSNRPAPEGVYYYILKARGWDKKEDDPNESTKYRKHGFFHLYRLNRR